MKQIKIISSDDLTSSIFGVSSNEFETPVNDFLKDAEQSDKNILDIKYIQDRYGNINCIVIEYEVNKYE